MGPISIPPALPALRRRATGAFARQLKGARGRAAPGGQGDDELGVRLLCQKGRHQMSGGESSPMGFNGETN